MKKRIISLYLLILSSLLFSQEQIIGEREILYKINLSSELLSYSLISPKSIYENLNMTSGFMNLNTEGWDIRRLKK